MPAQRRASDLEGRVASTNPSEFLPARLAGSRQPLEAPMLVDQLDLGLGRWLLVLEDASRWLTPALVEEGTGPRRAGAGDGVAQELLERAVTGRGRERTTFRGLGPIAFWKCERPIEVDQSNESIVVGGEAVVKRSVWITPGNERPVLLPAHLETAGFVEMAAPLGNASWLHPDGAAPLASIAPYLLHARDGWDWYVELLERSLEGRSADTVGPAAALGEITARFHVALATPTDVLSAPTVAADAHVVDEWRRNAEADLDAALSATGDEGLGLRESAGRIREDLLELRSRETVTIPIRGDLHVGRSLSWGGGLAVSDLDGGRYVPDLALSTQLEASG